MPDPINPEQSVAAIELAQADQHIEKMKAATTLPVRNLYAILAFISIAISVDEAPDDPTILSRQQELITFFNQTATLTKEDAALALRKDPHLFLARYLTETLGYIGREDREEAYPYLSVLFTPEGHQLVKESGRAPIDEWPTYELFMATMLTNSGAALKDLAAQGLIHEGFAKGYAVWEQYHDKEDDGIDSSLQVLLVEVMSHRDNTMSQPRIRLYDSLLEKIQRNQGQTFALKGKYSASELRIREHDQELYLLKLFSQNPDSFNLRDRGHFRKMFSNFFENPKNEHFAGVLKYSLSNPYMLFSFAHGVGLERELEAAIENSVLRVFAQSYPAWCRKNEGLIAQWAEQNGGPLLQVTQVQTRSMQDLPAPKRLMQILAKPLPGEGYSSRQIMQAAFERDRELIAFISNEENYAQFDKLDRQSLAVRLKVLFTPIQEKDGIAPTREEKMLAKEALERLSKPELFACLHMYDVAADFERADKHIVSPKLRLEYANWKRVKAGFIREWSNRHFVELQTTEFMQKAVDAASPETSKLYSLLAESLRGGATAPGFVTDFCNHVAAHAHAFDEDGQLFVRYQLKSWINPPGTPTERQRGFWNDVDVTAVIMAAGSFGLGKEMEAARASGFMPDEVALQYWLSLNPSPLREEVAVTFAEAMPTHETIVDSRLTQIDVDHAMVVSGNRTESMGPGQSDKDDMLGSESEKGVQFRTETLFTALLKDGASGIKHITVRWDKRAAEAEGERKAAKKAPLPYNLIDIEMQDGSRSRVVVCDHFGKMTYVCRDTAEWRETDILQVSDLRKDPKVWTAIHISDKQWVSLIQKVLYTPVDALEVDPKTRNSRWGLKGVLTETFVQAVVATGTLPPTSNATVVKEGPLAGRFRWSTLYNAANAGDISELPKGTTWRTLYAELTKEKGEYPALKEFMGRTEKITAGDIHVACTRFQQEFDLAVQAEFYDDIKVRGLSGHAVDLALRFGQVAGWETYLPEGAPAPQDLEDFVVRSGLAERDGMQLVAA